MKRSGIYLCLLYVLVLLFWPTAAQAWGCKGHQTVALIAEKHLTPETRQWVEKLLSENPIDPKLNRYCGGASPRRDGGFIDVGGRRARRAQERAVALHRHTAWFEARTDRAILRSRRMRNESA